MLDVTRVLSERNFLELRSWLLLVSRTRSELRLVLGLGTLFHLTNVPHSFPRVGRFSLLVNANDR